MIANKPSAWYAAFTCKCPQCKSHRLFIDPNPYHLKKFMEMYPVCPDCKQSFEPETGFYYGAMYMSYGFTVLLTILLFTLSYLIWGWTLFPFLLIDIVVLVVLVPFVFRLSRSTYLSLMFYIDNHFRNRTK